MEATWFERMRAIQDRTASVKELDWRGGLWRAYRLLLVSGSGLPFDIGDRLGIRYWVQLRLGPLAIGIGYIDPPSGRLRICVESSVLPSGH